MPKGEGQKKYSGEFKQRVVETMHNEHLSVVETAERFGLRHKRVQDWERIYLEEGPESLHIERRGRHSRGRPPKMDKQIEKDLIAELQWLRAENAYLKKLNALVQEREHREKRLK
jgi:transposase